MSLPDCFVPTGECGLVLCRVHENLSVDQTDASLYVRMGLLSHTEEGGFALTSDGFTAMWRYVEAAMGAAIMPNDYTAAILWRVDEGVDVSWADAAPLVQSGLLSIFNGPTARSSYELTDAGQEALASAMPTGAYR